MLKNLGAEFDHAVHANDIQGVPIKCPPILYQFIRPNN